MNIDLLTINNMFAGLGGALGAQKRQDTGTKGKLISPVADDKPTHVNSPEIETADNTAPDAGRSVSKKPAREFRHVLSEKTKGEDPQKSQNHAESKEQSGVSDPAKPADNVETRPAENTVPVPQSKEGITAKAEPKAGREPAQLIPNLKSEKSSFVTGHAAKSAEIKLVLGAEKGQLGLKTILPEKSNGLNGLKMVLPEKSNGLKGIETVLPDTSGITPAQKAQPQTEQKGGKIVPHNETAVDTKVLTNKGNIKELAPEVPAGLSVKADVSEKKAADTVVLVTSTPAKAPTVNTKRDVVLNIDGDEKGKKTATDAKKASVTPVQAKFVGKQAELPGASQIRRTPSNEANAGAGAQQTPSKSLGANGKESEHAGDEPSNGAAFRKLSAGDLQVSADPSKDQGRSAGAKNPSQNFEQILSHSSGHVPATQQSAASATNARTANLPGQTSANDVAADIGKQILESIHGSLTQQRADQQITVRLNPPELGKVFIKLQERDAELTGVLEVSRTQTRAEIQHALPQIIRNLADCGIHVKRFDVVLSDQGRPGHEAFGGQSPQNNGPYDHGSTNQNAWSDEANFAGLSEESANGGGYQNVSQWQDAFVGDRSINMLI
jgi:flagellar hook-length control protein FliK